MLLIHCPYCEEDRPELEFRHAGQAHLVRPANMAEISDEEFESYFFIRDNPKGLTYERWRHIHGCARFFNAVRDTITDKFVTTYKAGEKKPALPATAKAPAAKPAQAKAARTRVAKAAPRANSGAARKSSSAKKPTTARPKTGSAKKQ
jgi:sarcosine oxidase subunit delta